MKTGYAVVCAAALIFSACGEKIKPSVLPSVDSRTMPQEESWNSHITISDSGRVRAVVDAVYLCVFETSEETHLSQGVRVHFFDRQGSQTSVLTSDSGIVDENTNNLEADGHVIVLSKDGTELRTEKLYWDNRRQLIHTPEFVRIHSPRERLQGHGFESDQDLINYRIFQVTGESIER